MKSVSLILPLYNAEQLLPRVLPPIEQALASGAILEAIVVDDGSSDGGPALCRARGLTVLPSGGRLGPGGARNVGARVAEGDLLLFIDSDVVMNADVPSRCADALEQNPGAVAVFGSYDDHPAARGVVSQYRNLLHHHTHHQGREEASTFWAGCGAVLRSAFLEAGGFDTARYPYPSIEDIELGHRLRKRGGRILLRKAIQGTHLKRWTLGSMIHTDVFRRALPWARLMCRPDYKMDDLNVSPAERMKAVLALCFWTALLLSPLLPWLAVVAALALALAWAVNRSFFRLVWRRAGFLHMLAALLLHQIYYVYSTASFAYCVLEAGFSRRRPES